MKSIFLYIILNNRIFAADINVPLLVTADCTYIIIVQTILIILYRTENIKIGTVIAVQSILSPYPDNSEFILIDRCYCRLRDTVLYSDCLKMYILCKRKRREETEEKSKIFFIHITDFL